MLLMETEEKRFGLRLNLIHEIFNAELDHRNREGLVLQEVYWLRYSKVAPPPIEIKLYLSSKSESREV
jgi:hypothetical protein